MYRRPGGRRSQGHSHMFREPDTRVRCVRFSYDEAWTLDFLHTMEYYLFVQQRRYIKLYFFLVFAYTSAAYATIEHLLPDNVAPEQTITCSFGHSAEDTAVLLLPMKRRHAFAVSIFHLPPLDLIRGGDLLPNCRSVSFVLINEIPPVSPKRLFFYTDSSPPPQS